MTELNSEVKISNIVATGTLGYKIDFLKYRLEKGEKAENFIKNNSPLNNKLEIDGVKVLFFSSGKVVLYGSTIEQINKRWELVKEFAQKYKVV